MDDWVEGVVFEYFCTLLLGYCLRFPERTVAVLDFISIHAILPEHLSDLFEVVREAWYQRGRDPGLLTLEDLAAINPMANLDLANTCLQRAQEIPLSESHCEH